MWKILGAGCALVAIVACGNNKQIPVAEVLGVVQQAAVCVDAVQATVNDPACRTAVAPCRAAYQAGRGVVEANQ